MDRDQAIQSMKDAGKTGEYVSQDSAESVIEEEHYFRVPGTCTMICALVLRNGFTVSADAACADPANYIEETARQRSRAKAKEKIFQHLAYLICERQSGNS